VRFRSKGQPRGQMLAREQRRVTLIIIGGGLLFLLLTISGKSRWLTEMFSDRASAVKKAPVVSDALMGNSDLLPDEMEFVRPDSVAEAENYASMIDRTGAAQMESVARKDTSLIGDVPPRLTREIRDDVIGVLSTEAEAWFGTLRLAEKIPRGNQYQVPDGQFTLFMDSPQSCRGKPYVVRGQLRRLIKAPLPRSAETFGIRMAYDAWISTRDSGNQLIHIVALSADAALPRLANTGKDAPAVEVTGYFFKREGYAAKGTNGEGDLALTPLLLAGTIRHVPHRVVVTHADEMNPWLTWIGLGVCGAVLFLVWQFQVSDKVFRGTRTHQLTSPPVRPSFEGVAPVTIQQMLSEMEEHAKNTSPDTSLLLPEATGGVW